MITCFSEINFTTETSAPPPLGQRGRVEMFAQQKGKHVYGFVIVNVYCKSFFYLTIFNLNDEALERCIVRATIATERRYLAMR